MYKILCDDITIYDPKDKDLPLIDISLQLADNAAGLLEFTMLKKHPQYNHIKKLISKIEVYDDEEWLFSGRVIMENLDFQMNKKITCEGELAYLLDTTQPPKKFTDYTIRQFLEHLLNVHNSKSDKKFYVGAVTVRDDYNKLYRFTNNENTLECIKDKLIKQFNGHLRIRHEGGKRYLDYLENYPQTNAQTIEFGHNLLDYTAGFDITELCTVINPIGATLESETEEIDNRIDIRSVNNGSRYLINDEALKTYGWIEKTHTWDNVHHPEILLTKAKKYLSESQFEKMTIELKAIDLAMIDKKIKPIRLLDEVIAVSKPHGLNKRFPVTKITLRLDDPSQNTYTLGTEENRSLSSRSMELLSKIEELPTQGDTLKKARENARQIIETQTTGHVVTRPNEILIMDTADKNTAKKIWRWNSGGLGYFADGLNSDPLTAITMDGEIVGERITAGSIRADRLDISWKNKVEGQETRITEELEKNYWTSSITESKIKNSSNNILLEVNKNSEALKSTAADLRRYTREQVSKIDVKVDGIKTTVSDKFNKYYTKSEIDQKSDSITSMVSKKIGKDDVKSIIKQSSEEIQFAFNNINQSMKIVSIGKKINPRIGLRINNADGNERFQLDDTGLKIYGSDGVGDENMLMGRIGTNSLNEDPRRRGLVFDLDGNKNSYMVWAATDGNSSGYNWKFLYMRTAGVDGFEQNDTLYSVVDHCFKGGIYCRTGGKVKGKAWWQGITHISNVLKIPLRDKNGEFIPGYLVNGLFVKKVQG